MKYILFSLIVFFVILAIIPLLMRGLEIEQDMRRQQVAEVFNVGK